MRPYLDLSLYPDVEEVSQLPDRLESAVEQADYLQRVCAAWDFDIYPEPLTFDLLRTWRTVFDEFPLPDSPAYHTFRAMFGWPAVESSPNPFVRLTHEILDAAEGRDPDPCLNLV